MVFVFEDSKIIGNVTPMNRDGIMRPTLLLEIFLPRILNINFIFDYLKDS